MTDFVLSGRVEEIAPDSFFIIASAVPRDPEGTTIGPIVETARAGTPDEAQSTRSKLMSRIGERVRMRGGRVVEVEEA